MVSQHVLRLVENTPIIKSESSFIRELIQYPGTIMAAKKNTRTQKMNDHTSEILFLMIPLEIVGCQDDVGDFFIAELPSFSITRSTIPYFLNFWLIFHINLDH